ncbi:MAG: Crp/Fnr family transcriptional regulator [Rhodobacteraceae bacterium]|nr:Crp/Fnr family transcriptional regulator [Paracoccaceae bacterium]
MAGWLNQSGLLLEPAAEKLLQRVLASKFDKGTVLFRAGDPVQGFAVVLTGKVGVYLTGSNGREIQLYEISPGQTCVQSTLGLMEEETYSAEAICESACEIAFIPRAIFLELLDISSGFRGYVFGSFSARLQNMMALLEQVAFVRVEIRLAAELLQQIDGNNQIHATHQDLATKIGSAREVVSRRLETLSKRGLLQLSRGLITVPDRAALQELAKSQ